MRNTIHVLCVVLVCFAHPGRATPSMHFEVASHGMATVEINLTFSTPSPDSIVRFVVLPFELSPRHSISKPDDIELSVVVNRENYALLTTIVPGSATSVRVRIENAFNLIDERAKNRVKFQFDLSHPNFRRHASLRNQAFTISTFDIQIKLPKRYGEDELSFEPAKNIWEKVEPGTYAIEKKEVSGKLVYLAFPSPFGDSKNVAQIAIGLVAGIVTMLLGSSFLIRRRVGKSTLLAVLVLSLAGLALTYYFFNTLADPIGFLAWVIGIALPWTVAPFVCIWYLVRLSYDAEISGEVFVDEQRAQFVEVKLCSRTESGVEEVSRKTVNELGKYRFYIWCGRKSKTIFIQIDESGLEPKNSSDHLIERKSRQQVEQLKLARIPLKPLQTAQATAG